MDVRIGKGCEFDGLHTLQCTCTFFYQVNLPGRVLSAYWRVENELSGGSEYLSVGLSFGPYVHLPRSRASGRAQDGDV